MNVTASGVRKASASRRSTRNESERLRSAAKLSFARPVRRIGGSMDIKGTRGLLTYWRGGMGAQRIWNATTARVLKQPITFPGSLF